MKPTAIAGSPDSPHMQTSENTRRTAVTHRTVMAIALPIMASNISIPLLGIVDTAVVGQLGDAYYIGAVAVGAMIFSFLFWGFGFLRMGTTGLTAQADGAGDNDELRAVLGRALAIAAVAGIALILLHAPVGWIAFAMVDASGEVESHARSYFAIRIWSAPATLANYAILGWFIGLDRTPVAFTLQIILNGLNMALNALLVLVFDLKVEGVAIGTVIAETAAAGTGFYLVARELRRRAGLWNAALIRDAGKLRRTLAVNRDIMIRSLCLIFAISFFTVRGARFGDTTLAANAVLWNLFHLTSYLLDGFAFAAEVFVGKAVGARDSGRFRRAVAISSLWAGVVSMFVAAAFILFGGVFIDLLTVNEEVRAAARHYLPWVVLAPVAAVACFQLDGIYVGATRTNDMRNMMVLSLAIYFAAWWILEAAYGNHGLWASMIVLFAARGATLGIRYPVLLRDTFARPASAGDG